MRHSGVGILHATNRPDSTRCRQVLTSGDAGGWQPKSSIDMTIFMRCMKGQEERKGGR